jgi:hypothetical protein
MVKVESNRGRSRDERGKEERSDRNRKAIPKRKAP